MNLTFQNVHVTLGKREILHGVTLTAAHGQITGIVGPNGCGKSTLVKSLFGIVPITSGTVLLGEADRAALTPKQIAAQVGYVGQDSAPVFDFTVREIVEMGLYARGARASGRQAAVEEAMHALEITHLRDRSILSLSGGERKMAFLARVIAQGVDTIVLDEPTNHLDICHQLFIMNYLRRSGKTVLAVLHDLSLAAHYCDGLYLMQAGRVVAGGPPEAVLNQEAVHAVFGVWGQVLPGASGRAEFHLDMNRD